MFEQLQSKYFKEDGIFKIRYSIKVTKPFVKFSSSDLDWIEAVGDSFTGECPEIILSESDTVASWVEVSDNRAIKYSDSELNFIFRHTTYLTY